MQGTPKIDDKIDIVLTDQLELRIVEQVHDVVAAAGEKVVEAAAGSR